MSEELPDTIVTTRPRAREETKTRRVSRWWSFLIRVFRVIRGSTLRNRVGRTRTADYNLCRSRFRFPGGDHGGDGTVDNRRVQLVAAGHERAGAETAEHAARHR